MAVYTRYPEDLTGTNPDNLVMGEIINLSTRPIRVAVPKYGPFFADSSFVVFDNLTQRRLEKGTDYVMPMILQEAVLRTGKDVADAFIIMNSQVSSQLRISYQSIGGHYQSNIDNIVNIYESFLVDARSVDWVTGIYGKPSNYSPSPHPHWLSDIYGFEPIAVELERIAKAIELVNTTAFEVVLDAIQSKGATKAEMENGTALKKFVTLEGLMHVVDKYGFNQISLRPATSSLKNGRTLWFDVDASYVPATSNYVWQIVHETTTPDDFAAQNGLIPLSEGIGRFMIQSLRTLSAEQSETFRVIMRLGSLTGPVVARSKLLTMTQHGTVDDGGIVEAMVSASYTSPFIKQSAETMYVSRSFSNASYS